LSLLSFIQTLVDVAVHGWLVAFLKEKKNKEKREKCSIVLMAKEAPVGAFVRYT
jgi:hypothetical protein